MLRIGDVRASAPVVVPGELPLRACLETLEERGVGHLLVRRGRGDFGLLHDYQLHRCCRRAGNRWILRSAYAERPAASLAVTAEVVEPRGKVVDVLAMLATSWEDAVLVADGGRPVSLFTLDDALALATGWLTPWWKVGQAMTRVGWGLPGNTPVRRALHALWAERRLYTLVCHGATVTDALTLRELVAVDPKRRAVLDDLRRPGQVLAVSEETRLLDAVRVLRGMKRHCLPVVGRGRRPLGIFTVNDVLRALGRSMNVSEVRAS